MDKETGHDPNIRVMSLSRLVTWSFLGRHGGYSPLSHGGHTGYGVWTLGIKSRRCVSNLRFAAINHAKQKSFQCALMCRCAQITDQKVN